ncbi:hypothetical protein [Egicoccus sp. AB-alg2]|uniref:hypothetical protein n=1 Tax=Egicoccus sp. AB-alg2 TaxID=3242693 RepID=UPI00359E938F
MDRTLRAAVLAAFIGFATVAGLGTFLGFDPSGSLLAGVVVALVAGLLIWAAARRAETFHQPTPPSPGFPGPPDRPDGTPSDPSDPAFGSADAPPTDTTRDDDER